MGMLLRLFLFLCLLYLVVRWVKSWWREDERRVSGDPKPQVRHPLGDAEIMDAKFTELPPESREEKSTDRK